MKARHGDLIKVVWNDIRGDSSWTDLPDELSLAECTNFGIFNCIKDKNVYLFASFHDESVGDRIVIPQTLVKSITIIKKNVYGRKKSGNPKRL